MKQNEIIEGNKVIADFAALKSESGYWLLIVKSDSGWFNFLELKYNESWDWLMPVVEKIESLGYYFMINKWTSAYTNGADGDRISITTVEGKTKILNTWKAVVEFIKWHNQNNSK